MNTSEKREVINYLSRFKLMSLGTYYRHPWAASVYYLYDEDYNFYFVSNPNTKHCQNISKNPKVSVTIADPSQDPKGNKIGFQAWGLAKEVKSVKDLKNIIASWNKRGFVPITYKLFVKAWKSRFYKIKLNEVQMFDENKSENSEVRNWKL